MHRYSVLFVALAAAFVPLTGGVASAGEPPEASPTLASETSPVALDGTAGVAPALSSSPVALDVAAVAGFVPSPGNEAPAQFAAGNGYLESIRYRPRRGRTRERDRGERDREYYEDSRRRSQGFAQLHGGFFDPDGDLTSGVLFGFRLGTSFDDHMQLGLGADWNHRSDRQSSVVQEVPLPGGGTAERRLELSRSSSDLFPILASLQVSPGGSLPLIPYFGVGGGYEVLFISAEDFSTGDQFDATYGGWGWQAWAGIGFPLSGRNRLNAEVFLNNAEVGRDVDDAAGTFREVVNMDGVGMRFALSWGF